MQARLVSRLIYFLLTTGGLLLVTGCTAVRECSLTYQLWSNEPMRNHREPAEPPHPKFFRDGSRQDFLVQYDEVNERTEAIRRRAYFLGANLKRVKENRRPRFVNPDRTNGLNELPVVQASESPANSTSLVFAAVSAKGDQFSIHAEGETVGFHSLPVYADRSHTAVQLFVTPLAVGGDIVMVGLVASAIVGWNFCTSGASFGF